MKKLKNHKQGKILRNRTFRKVLSVILVFTMLFITSSSYTQISPVDNPKIHPLFPP